MLNSAGTCISLHRSQIALKHFTEDDRKTVENISCPGKFIRRVDGELILLSAFLSITAFLGNILILVALHKETSLHPPSKLLYRNLAITDLCIGISAEPPSTFFSVCRPDEDEPIVFFDDSFMNN